MSSAVAAAAPAAITIDQFCETFAIGRSRTYAEIREGRLKVRKVGRRTVILLRDANDWLENLPAGGPRNAAA